MKKKSSQKQIEDVTEAFNGCRRKTMVPLSDAFPDIAALWDYKKNCGWGPEDFSSSSETFVWWKCPKEADHEWKASIAVKTSKRTTHCPFCVGKAVCLSNSLQTMDQEIAARWHPRKNGKLLPTNVTAHSGKRVWWLCEESPDHEWQASVVSVQRSESNKGCPFCASKKVSPTNSLKSLFPKLAKQWHPSKNGKLKPNQITAGSHQKVWWQCKQGHSFQSAPHQRTITNRDHCPECNKPARIEHLRRIGAKKRDI